MNTRLRKVHVIVIKKTVYPSNYGVSGDVGMAVVGLGVNNLERYQQYQQYIQKTLTNARSEFSLSSD